MSTMFSLPRAPSDLPKAICYAPLSGAKAVNVERMGREFQRYMYRLEHNISESRQQELQGSDYDSEFGIKDRVTAQTLELDEWDPDLLDLDPSEWKEQDHYAVLGLSKLRWRASSEQIKLAYRRRILEHHPDKKASSGDPHDDRFFKCIQRAYDQLSDPVRRRQYDSVDPQVSFDIPEQADPSHFFEVYAPVFEREARFSKRQPVIDIGGPDSSREHVEAFYKFWSDFDSWRSFEYLDEEKERVENRDEKRWYEKQNRAKRAQRKKEDNARIRKLATTAMSIDPRIEKFKEEDRRSKELKRQQREEAARRAKEEEERRAREEELAEQMHQNALRIKAAEEKKEKERQKKELKRQRQVIRNLVKDHNFLANVGESLSVPAQERRLAELNILLENMALQDTQRFIQQAEGHGDNVEAIRADVAECITKVIEKAPAVANSFTTFVLGSEIAAKFRMAKSGGLANADNSLKRQRPWDAKELELLIKASNKFPGGTVDRWETISEWLSRHSGRPQRTNEELIKKTNELKRGSAGNEGVDVRQLQSQKANTKSLRLKEEATIRYDGPSSTPPAMPAKDPKGPATAKSGEQRPWTTSEQTQLEKALRVYPPTWKGEGDRWDKIAEMVDGRTKKECKQRVKFLAQQIKARKQ